MWLFGLFLACSPAPDRFTPTWRTCSDGRTLECDAALARDVGAVETTEPLLDGLWELLRVASEVDEDMEESEQVHTAYLRWVRSAPGRTPGESLYNRVTEDIRAVVIEPGRIHVEGRTVYWNEGYERPEYAAATVVHEARHCAVHSPHRTCRDDPSLTCDRNWRGAFGAEVGFATWAATTAEGWPNHYEGMAADLVQLIED